MEVSEEYVRPQMQTCTGGMSVRPQGVSDPRMYVQDTRRQQMTIEQLETENKQLKSRCAAMTKGLIYQWCDYECDHRANPYDKNFIPEDPKND